MENENNSGNRGTIVEIPSTQTFIVGGKVITMSPKSEAEAIAGEKLSKEELKSRIVTGVKKNGEKKAKENENKENKFNKKVLIPLVLVPLLVLSMAKGCSRDIPQPIMETIPVNAIVYQIDNPYPILEGIVNSYGQEGMTANAKEGSAFYGEHYTSGEQADAEQRASEGTKDFELIQNAIKGNLEVLTSPDSSQEQKAQAAKNLLELSNVAKQAYLDNEEFGKEYAERFKEASLAYEDSNTQNEIFTVDQMVENYMAEMGLSSKNVEAIQQIVDYFEQGYELDLEGIELEDGDYIITGEGVREVAEEEGVNLSAWQKFKNFLKGDRAKTTNKDTNDFEK